VLKKKIACCGDACNYCPRYTATLNKDNERMKEIAILWNKIGWRESIDPPEKLVCYGCEFFEDPCEYNVKECCLEKKIENCGECSGYPCEKIKNAFEITQKNAEKFKDILSDEEYRFFEKAFFSKKENLEKVRNGVFHDSTK